MSGMYIGRVEDFEPPKPHTCLVPRRQNFATGQSVPEGESGQVWRCDCGKAYQCVIESDPRDHDSWTVWRRYTKADAENTLEAQDKERNRPHDD